MPTDGVSPLDVRSYKAAEDKGGGREAQTAPLHKNRSSPAVGRQLTSSADRGRRVQKLGPHESELAHVLRGQGRAGRYLPRAFGKVFSGGLSNFMADKIGKAGCPRACTHGCERARPTPRGSRCSSEEIAAITGHRTDGDQRFTKRPSRGIGGAA